MATIPADVVLLQPWPLFTAYDTAGHALVGGKLYSFQAGTSTPKATFNDPFLLTANANPAILDANGQHLVYLDGFYRLVLTDAEDVQLWEVDNYAWEGGAAPTSEGLVSGMTEAVNVTPVAGSAVISVPNLVPLGYRCLGAIVKITTDFGASQGLASLAIGDNILLDRWGVCGLTTGLETGQRDFRSGDMPIAATAYSVLISAMSGTFDGAGALSIRAFWESITGWS